jgi:hypothetical protein
MAILPPIFLESTLHTAKEHGIEAHTLSGNKGLLLFAEGVAASEQCLLLKQITAELKTAHSQGKSQATQTENNVSAGAPGTIDCQVSVEERAQLFKFLTG